MPVAVLHHSALPHRGGAARVARLLLEAQRAAGLDARLSFEVAENDPENLDAPPATAATPPEALGRAQAALPPGCALHLHGSTDWPALLEGLLDGPSPARLLLTLHDAQPLTGGCAYPLDCPHFPACVEPCPRGFVRARSRQRRTLGLLERLGPTLVSPSRWLAGLAKACLPGAAIRVIPNGAPWPERPVPRRQARTELGLPPDAPVALFAAHGGTRAAYKSGADWTALWDRLAGLVPNALGFAVGGDDMTSHGRLAVWPYLDRDRLALLMRAADCLIYPTLADNHPLVLIEAAGLELPVAAYAAGGVPEIVRHGETGLLCATGDSAALLDHAASLLTSPALRSALGRNARELARKHFDAARMAADYRKLLEE